MDSDGYFDARIAETYDADVAGDPEILRLTVERLAELADGGATLEFAIGTGRVALPLAEQGVPVSGIELSNPMVEQLRAKAGGDDMNVVIGDMTSVKVPGDFSLVFLVFNTIDNLTTQDAQVACFQNAADHLSSGGRFVVETLVPPAQFLKMGETLRAFERSESHWGVDEIDVATQNYVSHHVWFEDGETRKFSVPFRFAWPSEMDLMAKMAGMELEHRWSDWEKSRFDAQSKRHISVWRKV